MKRFELEGELNHPKNVAEHIPFIKRVYKTNAWGHPFIKFTYALEQLWYNMIRGNFKVLGILFSNKIKRMLGINKHK